MARARPEVVIADELVAVEPGQVARTTLTVRNTGTEIAEYSVSVVPDCTPVAWTDAAPASFRLLPGTDCQVTLSFRPPLDSATAAGTVAYGVLVTPVESKHQAPVVAEAEVAVGAIHALEATLRPPRSRGRWRGRHIIRLHNRGTEKIQLRLSASDDQEALSYGLKPVTVAVPARGTAEAMLRVRPRDPKLVGRPADNDFRVSYRRRVGSGKVAAAALPSGGVIEAEVSGSFTQKPVLSPLLLTLLSMVAAVLVLLLALRPWVPPPAVVPPEPPQNVAVSAAGDAILVEWDHRPGFTGIAIREIDCATASDIIPATLGSPVMVQPLGPGPQQHRYEPAVEQPEHCLQVRSVAGDSGSIWVPSPAYAVGLGEPPLEPPVIEAGIVNGCVLQVDFEPVAAPGRDVLYEVSIDGVPQGEVVAEGGQRYPDQPPGLVDVFVQSVEGAVRSPRSNIVTVDVPVGCDSAPRDLSGRYWLLVLGPAPELDPSLVTTWQAIGAEIGLDRDQALELGVVDGPEVESAIRLPLLRDVRGNPLPAPAGSAVLFVDAYGDDEEAAMRARNDCVALNLRALDVLVEDAAIAATCALVHPDGTVEALDLPSGEQPVPDVVGAPESEAVDEIEGAGLVAAVDESCAEFSSTIAAGNVLSQVPPSGSMAATGSTVTLCVSLGPGVATPSVTGMTSEAAEQTLADAGLQVVVKAWRLPFGEPVPAGTVVSQDPKGGTLVAPDSSVTIFVADVIVASTDPPVLG